MLRSVLGLDIGGANLKAAHTDGTAINRPFALWKNPTGLTRALHELIRGFPPSECVAVTMTGELCDCYETKRAGVTAILEAVRDAIGPARVWTNRGRFVTPDAARARPLEVAAANWLALATYVGRYAPDVPALLIDIGSTTTDMVPLESGTPQPRGHTDPERLQARELVYTGVRRTPLCALLGPEAAAEWFATTLDVYLFLGDLPEDPDDRDTADGRPATRRAAHARLARMLCADSEICGSEQTRQIAMQARSTQIAILQAAVQSVCGRLLGTPRTVILSGSGEFLGRELVATMPELVEARIVSLEQTLGAARSHAACAYAAAVLAAEESDVE